MNTNNNNNASHASVTASGWIFTMHTIWEFTRFILNILTNLSMLLCRQSNFKLFLIYC